MFTTVYYLQNRLVSFQPELFSCFLTFSKEIHLFCYPFTHKGREEFKEVTTEKQTKNVYIKIYIEIEISQENLC